MNHSYTLNLRGRLVQPPWPVVMGVINLTPDSFYAGSRKGFSDLLHTVEQMIKDGAYLIDLGAQSTRPGAPLVSEKEEMERLIPAVQQLNDHFPQLFVSVDTFYGRVAEAAVHCGAAIINDISAGQMDSAMWPLIARLGVPYVLMHMRGTPQTMSTHAQYTDVVNEVVHSLSEKLYALRQMGVRDILIDPGFGFAKETVHNYELLGRLHELQVFGLPLLVGMSRKRFLQHASGSGPEGALHATTAAHMAALLQGAAVLRAHDVKAAADAIAVFRNCAEAVTEVNPR